MKAALLNWFNNIIEVKSNCPIKWFNKVGKALELKKSSSIETQVQEHFGCV